MIFFIRVFLIVTFSVLLIGTKPAFAQDASALSQQAFQECKQRIMQFSDEDIKTLVPNQVIESCQSFPLSDDVFVQVLGAMIGTDFKTILDIYSALTDRPHGFIENDPLFLVATPLHKVLEATNYASFIFFLALVGGAVLMQMFRLQKGEEGFDFREWYSKNALGYLFSGAMSFPLIGWMTPIQALAVLIIVLFGYVAKMVVVYIFLAAFVGDLQTSIVDSVSFSVSKEMGANVIMHRCDIENREMLVVAMNNSLPVKSRANLEADPLYRCLTESALQASDVVGIGAVSIGQVEAIFTPHPIARTQKCIYDNASRIAELQVDVEDCGTVKFSMPPNLAGTANGSGVAPSIQNAIDLYANEEVIASQRNIAIKMLEYQCRDTSTKTQSGGLVDSCLIPFASGSGYSYNYNVNPVTNDETLSVYNEPLTETSRKVLIQDIKTQVGNGIESLKSNTSGIRQHIKDIISPFSNESDLTKGKQDQLMEMRNRVDNEGSLGFSESDATFLVNNIKRGAWTASSLFFSGVSASVDESFIVESIANVYDVNGGDWAVNDFLNDPIYDILQAYFLVQKSVQSNPLEYEGDFFDKYVSVQGLAVPRVGLYMDSLDCWFDQADCKRSPMNPFAYLSTQGMSLINQSLTRVITYGAVGKVAASMVELERGPNGRPLNHNRHKFMVLDTLKDFSYIYFFIGVLLAIALPLIPLLRILVMMVNWTYDVIKELISLQIKIALSPMGDQGGQVVSEDVREAFGRLVALGLYFLFIIVGIGVMFMMFSFLYALNVFLVGALSSVISVSFNISAIEAMVLGIIFDVIVTFILTYEVVKCSSYIERIPRAMAEHFGVQISSSEGTASGAFLLLRRYVPSYFQNTVSSFGKAFKR
jgi:hypothetical protein